MKRYLKIVFPLLILAAVFMFSCQSSDTEIAEQNPQNLTLASDLTGLLIRVANNTTDNDFPIDSTNCATIKMPYAIFVHDQQGDVAVEFSQSITNTTELTTAKTVIAGLEYPADNFSLVFPVTVVLQDGTEQVLQNHHDLQVLRAGCQSDPGYDSIACLNLNYPITIFNYDSDFQLANTYTIESNLDMLGFLYNLSPADYYAIDYPIAVTKSDGQIVTINNNSELNDAIQAAIAECFPVINPCTNPNILMSGLIVYMPFANEAKDLISFEDAIRNDNFPLTFVTDRDGNANGAISMSGQEFDVLKIPETDMNHLKQNDSITVSVWFRQQLIDNISPDRIFEKSNDCNCDSGFIVGYSTAPYFGQFTQGIFDSEWSNDPNLSNDTQNWHHFVVTVAPGNAVKLYRDGELRFSTIMPNLNIGEWFGNYVIGKHFRGYVDDLRVYRKTLSADDVQILFNLEGDNNTCVQ
ncbi:LamG domain-containing protein [Flavobacterium sp. 3HN19-14]|uniref:LamG domain-containing protein n=1 Tax=Flavobacterium sp. 3HN19-14 TaxID=3448133 RepID=UPI003EE37630